MSINKKFSLFYYVMPKNMQNINSQGKKITLVLNLFFNLFILYHGYSEQIREVNLKFSK